MQEQHGPALLHPTAATQSLLCKNYKSLTEKITNLSENVYPVVNPSLQHKLQRYNEVFSF